MIIVSMTSWKKRLNNIPTILDSIFKQTMLPDKIIINLSVDEFPKKENELPKALIEYIKKHEIIEIYWVDGVNTKQWKKFIPTMQRFPDDWIVCIDDDKIYQDKLIETLWRKHCEYPNNPICGGTCIYHGFKCHAGPCSLVNLRFYEGMENYLCDEIYKMHSSDLFFTYLATKNGYPYVYCGYDFERRGKKFNEFEPMHLEKSVVNKLDTMWKYLERKYGRLGSTTTGGYNIISAFGEFETDKTPVKKKNGNSVKHIQGTNKHNRIIRKFR